MDNEVVIIGCRNLGMSYAYALLNQRTYVNKLYLIDLEKKKLQHSIDTIKENIKSIGE